MTEHANEEAEMTQEFGQLVRMLTGSGMQVHEANVRRQQARSAEQARMEQQRQGQEAAMAQMVSTTLQDRTFWATAGSEEIADHVTVAAHLSPTQHKAQKAYMQASDMLRNEYGINLEEINRDHPTALGDRHAALRDELDSYFQRQGVQHEQSPEPIALDPTFQLEAQDRPTIEHDAATFIGPAVSVDQEAGRLIRSEQASAAKADQYHAENQQDKKHALTETVTGGRESQAYQRVTPQQYEALRNTTSEWLADARHRQGLMFAKSTQDRVFNSRPSKIHMPKPQNRPFRGMNRQHNVGIAR